MNPGDAAVLLLALWHHSKKVASLIQGRGFFCMEFSSSYDSPKSRLHSVGECTLFVSVSLNWL